VDEVAVDEIVRRLRVAVADRGYNGLAPRGPEDCAFPHQARYSLARDENAFIAKSGLNSRTTKVKPDRLTDRVDASTDQ
jgi:hypothetical protein